MWGLLRPVFYFNSQEGPFKIFESCPHIPSAKMNAGYCSLNSRYMCISSSVHTRGFMNPRTCSWYLKDQCGLKPMRDREYCFPNPKEEFEIKRNGKKKQGKMGENKMKNNFIFQCLVLEIDT